jgi:hypothetical protein
MIFQGVYPFTQPRLVRLSLNYRHVAPQVNLNLVLRLDTGFARRLQPDVPDPT